LEDAGWVGCTGWVGAEFGLLGAGWLGVGWLGLGSVIQRGR